MTIKNFPIRQRLNALCQQVIRESNYQSLHQYLYIKKPIPRVIELIKNELDAYYSTALDAGNRTPAKQRALLLSKNNALKEAKALCYASFLEQLELTEENELNVNYDEYEALYRLMEHLYLCAAWEKKEQKISKAYQAELKASQDHEASENTSRQLRKEKKALELDRKRLTSVETALHADKQTNKQFTKAALIAAVVLIALAGVTLILGILVIPALFAIPAVLAALAFAGFAFANGLHAQKASCDKLIEENQTAMAINETSQKTILSTRQNIEESELKQTRSQQRLLQLGVELNDIRHYKRDAERNAARVTADSAASCSKSGFFGEHDNKGKKPATDSQSITLAQEEKRSTDKQNDAFRP